MTCSDFPVPANDHALEQCIALVQSVSYVASTHDFYTTGTNATTTIPNRLGHIHQGEQHASGANIGWWRTWFHPAPFVDGTTQIDACCFFQRMRSQSNKVYSVCIGFNKSMYPMGTGPTGKPTDCANFINQFMSNAAEDTFCYFVKNCLVPPAGSPPYVYVVEMSPTSIFRNSSWDAARDALFAFMKTNPTPSVWTLQPVGSQSFTTYYKPLHENVNLWKLTVTAP
jgi:hypothetical protein